MVENVAQAPTLCMTTRASQKILHGTIWYPPPRALTASMAALHFQPHLSSLSGDML